MPDTQIKPGTLVIFRELPVATLFVKFTEGTSTARLENIYRKLADEQGEEMVRFRGDLAYPLYGRPGLDPDRYVRQFSVLQPNDVVICGPHITSRNPYGGNISKAGLALLPRLLEAPELELLKTSFYPGKRRFFESDTAQDMAHDAIGSLKDHQAVEIRGAMVSLTIIGLNRALQEKHSQVT